MLYTITTKTAPSPSLSLTSLDPLFVTPLPGSSPIDARALTSTGSSSASFSTGLATCKRQSGREQSKVVVEYDGTRLLQTELASPFPRPLYPHPVSTLFLSILLQVCILPFLCVAPLLLSRMPVRWFTRASEADHHCRRVAPSDSPYLPSSPSSSTPFKMARGNQRDKAREKNEKAK